MSESFEGYAIVELMGHKRLAGYVSEAELAGSSFLRVDVEKSSGDKVTQYYSPGAVYCITPSSEDTVRGLLRLNSPEPVSRWELPSTENYPEPDDDDELPC